MTIAQFKIFIISFVYFTGGLLFSVKGQESWPLNFLPGLAQSSILNPAVQNKTDKLVIGLPVVSGIHFDWDANINLNSLSSNNFKTYDVGAFYNSIEKTGDGSFSGNISMFYASLKIDDWNFTISLSDRVNATTKFDSDIVKLIRDGINNYYGANENVGSAKFDFLYYRELAFGFSKKIWKQMDVGIRPKIYFGKFYFETHNTNLLFETDTENRELLLKPEGSFTLSAPVIYNSGADKNFINFSANVLPGDYFFNLRNLGLAVDLGIVFRPNKHYEFSASVRDIGFIGFKHNTFNVDFTDPIRYNENNLYQSVNFEESHYLEPREALKALGDSVSYIISVENANIRTFTSIPVNINFSGKYNFSKTLSGGFSNQFFYLAENSINQFSGFVHSSIKDKFEVAGSLTLYNFSKFLVGFGGSYSTSFSQIYFSSNNILGIFQATTTKNLNLCFGINLLFTTKNY
ncbi:MAG: hypothetical protein HN778_10375 [Prolixibacteraceae bacterium]|jgi:hypothetical protein|nr:hypothetical protein [Prolixibacteraceae bacterium]MBT6004184.1 hypothetical protein [Prolixibacteraceae bacterium]MBT6765256.1 hypothetical protein [Prolixibacteraceae bacterium]MBT6999394.1 hypothetical protein [Prolixibacteraceae bacterium]MBT7395228.1 hypothetical protein [Prolixibacteraceae bacterium]